MEISGLVSRQIPYFAGAGIDPLPSKNPFSGEVRFPARNKLPASFRAKRVDSNSGFCDKGHVEYYYTGPTCGIKKKEKEIKKKLKLLKGLTELSSSSSLIGSGSVEGSVALAQGKLISERAEALLKELEEVRGEEKEMKRRKKEEKARFKAERMKVGCGTCESSSSSSSSSESSDSECEEVIDMKRVRGEILEGVKPLAGQERVALLAQPSLVVTVQEDKCGNGTSTSSGSNVSIDVNNAASCSDVMEAPVVAKVEVCMGKKCKASGGVELMEEFERLMGVQGSVVRCKCLGKCKNGPNVRVLNSVDGIESKEGKEDSVRNPMNPLYIGVGLEDVSLIVANLMGEVENDSEAATAT